MAPESGVFRFVEVNVMWSIPVRIHALLQRGALFLALASVVRLVLAFTHLTQFERPFTQLLPALLTGLRYDVLVALLVLTPYALSVFLLPARTTPKPWRIVLRQLGNLIFIFALLYLGVVEYFFFDEFNARFNYVAVDYLLFPHEVFVNIWDSYPVGKALSAVLFLTYLLHRYTWQALRQSWQAPLARRQRLLYLSAYAGLTVLAFSTLGINSAQLSANRVANELALNGYYSFAHALRSNELDYNQYYRQLPAPAALARVQKQILLPNEQWLDPEHSLARHIDAKGPEQALNVVLILEESFGSEFSGLLHPEQKQGATPEFDAIAQQGLLYSHIYASGNRTVRGLEATLTSFVPIPGQSIVKRPGGSDVFSLPSLLKAKGYQTRFIYGGMGYFDNMAPFALANGFETAVDQTDFAKDEVAFSTIWGVSDEDLFNRSLKELDQMAAAGKPFFSTILTVSNHKPYLYPAGRITEDPLKQRRRHVVKYADYALGKFMRDAKSHAWFDNTLFVMLGDHGARVYGAEEIPISSYEIPLVFYAPKHIKSERDDRLGSQIDVGPTIMGLLNSDYNSAFFGRDLRRIGTGQRYALLSHNRDVALLRDDYLSVLGIQQTAHRWRVLNRDGELVQESVSAQDPLLADTIALYQTGYNLFKAGQWRPLPQLGHNSDAGDGDSVASASAAAVLAK